MRREICGVVVILCIIIALAIYGSIDKGGSAYLMLLFLPLYVVEFAALRIGNFGERVRNDECSRRLQSYERTQAARVRKCRSGNEQRHAKACDCNKMHRVRKGYTI